MALRKFKLDDTRSIPPIEFTLETPDGTEHTFRATRRPPLDVVQAWFAVRVMTDGTRHYEISTLVSALQRLIIKEEWVAHDDNGAGEWKPVDDLDRFMALVASDNPYRLSHTELAALVMGLLDEATANPTGAPN